MSLPKWQTASGIIGSATVKQPFTFVLQADSALNFSLISGSLPPGLSLSSNGIISGTITNFSTSETSKFVVRASNNNGITDRTFIINVLSPNTLKWITPQGFVDAGTGSEFYVVNRTRVNYNFFAGYGFNVNLSANSSTGTTVLYVNTLTNLDLGSTGIWREISAPGVVQGTTITNISSTYNIPNQGYPLEISQPVQNLVTGTIAVFDQTPFNKKVNYYVDEKVGQLPPGLSLSKDGILSGYVNDQLSANIKILNGGYDGDSYSVFNYDYADIVGGESTRIVNRYVPKIYQFSVIASDVNETVSREFKIIVVDPSNLKSDGSLTYASGPLSAQSGFIISPEWLETAINETTNPSTIIN